MKNKIIQSVVIITTIIVSCFIVNPLNADASQECIDRVNKLHTM